LVEGAGVAGAFDLVVRAASGAVVVLGLGLVASKPLAPVFLGATTPFGFVVVVALVLVLVLVPVLELVSGCLVGTGGG
jgi:hypothetical protein